MNIREKVLQYLLSNPIDRTKKDPYGEVAKKFQVSTEVVRCQWRKLRARGQIKEETKLYISYKIKDSIKQTGDTLEIVKDSKKRVKTLQDLISVCDIDLKIWEIISWECNKWEVGAKMDDGTIVVEPLFQVKAKLRAKKLDSDLYLQKEELLKELKAYSPKVSKIEYKREAGSSLLEIAIPDLHLGSLSWEEESGENYDIKIAEKRYKAAIRDLLSRVDLKRIERILFPIGNDMVNVDNKNNTTTNGTVVDTDVRFIKMVRIAKRILIEVIDELSQIAPVDVVTVSGNHDFTVIFMIADMLDAWYHNNPNVTIFNSPTSRKAYKYGKVALFFTHGDEEPMRDLGLIFATEYPDIWSGTEFRFVQVGHHHKSKKTSYVSVDEFPGIQVQILPTLSSRTNWAYKKGYNSLKQAKAFEFCKTKGLLGEFTYTI